MPDDKTQEATPFRRRKAREQGQIARSRELPSALALLTIVMVLGGFAETFVAQWRQFFSQGLAMSHTQSPDNLLYVMEMTMRVAGGWTFPCLVVGLVLSVFGNVVQGGFIFATAGLTPSFSRLSPATNLKKRFSVGGLSNFLKSIIPMAVIAYLAFGIVTRDWTWIVFSTMQTARVSITWLMGRVYELAWKAGAVFLAWSGVDYLLQRTQLSRQLRMTRQEVVQENKDNIGNPQIKCAAG
jgi:flagellar biosynthesis protein FlhB